MDAADFKRTLDQLMTSFYKRMDSFEGQLQKTSTTPTTEALATEFSAFKTFVVTSMKALQAQIQCLAKETDQLQMRSRRKILLFHGLPEDAKENVAEVICKTVISKLKFVNFVTDDISRCHRMGRLEGSSKPRPILCKFKDVAVRDKIWSSKTSLKGSGFTISEFLTKTRHSVFMAARERFGITKCWTREGLVFVLDADGIRHRLSCQDDLDGIPNKPAQKPSSASKESAAPTRAKRAVRK